MLLLDLYRPWYLIYLSAYYGVLTIYTLLSSGQYSTLLSLSAFRTQWFARFWSYFGPLSAQNGAPVVAPMLATARGRVLDIGSGAGNWLQYYDPAKVTKLYAVEPNTGHHKTLLANAKKAGLGGVIEIVEDLKRAKIEKESIDTVVTVQVLCSVGVQQPLISDIYSCLAKGGRWLVYEHVKRKNHTFIIWYQAFLNLIWPIFLGGCSLCQRTDEQLKNVGKWKDFSLGPLKEDSPTTVIPSIRGILTKG